MSTHCWICNSELIDGKCGGCGYDLASLKQIEISVNEVKSKLDKKEDFIFLDVRNPDEVEIAKIDGSKNIPLNKLSQFFNSLSKDKEIVTHCHHGVRSLHAANFLVQKGFKVKSMKGGIDFWSLEIDSSVPRY